MENKLEKEILKYLDSNPVIPCTSSFDEILLSDFNNIKVVLLYDLNIFDLLDTSRKNINAKKHIILNLDTVKGIACDEYGLSFLKKILKINIIASSSPKIINCSKKLNFLVVQTIFLFDTKSLKKGVDLVKKGKPNFIDIRPGISYLKAIKFLKYNLTNAPIICSGFIQNKTEVQNIIDHGVKAITTSNKELWNLYK